MKKLLILLLVIVMVCSFIACNKKATGGADDVSSEVESTYSQVSVYEEDEEYTSSELQEIVSQFKETVSIGIEFPDPSSEDSSTETPDASSFTTTTTSSDVTSGGTSADTSTDASTENTSSTPAWLGPF